MLSTLEWQTRAQAHLERMQRWTLPWRERRSRQEQHPVYDFLFQYYMYSPAKLEAWHPAPGEALADSPEARERFGGWEYRVVEWCVERDPARLTDRMRARLQATTEVLVGTQERGPNFGCYGVHEWAMVYGGHDIRHAGITPLRLPQAEIDAFVESRPVACSHYEAFRFFAPEARPFNRVALEWETRHEMEQPGCIHANMDLYKWAYTSMPWIGSDLLADCFELAVELRVLDMQASPYDVRTLGWEPVCVETPQGREEYQKRQRALSEQARPLRDTLIAALRQVAA